MDKAKEWKRLGERMGLPEPARMIRVGKSAGWFQKESMEGAMEVALTLGQKQIKEEELIRELSRVKSRGWLAVWEGGVAALIMSKEAVEPGVKNDLEEALRMASKIWESRKSVEVINMRWELSSEAEKKRKDPSGHEIWNRWEWDLDHIGVVALMVRALAPKEDQESCERTAERWRSLMGRPMEVKKIGGWGQVKLETLVSLAESLDAKEESQELKKVAGEAELSKKAKGEGEEGGASATPRGRL